MNLWQFLSPPTLFLSSLLSYLNEIYDLSPPISSVFLFIINEFVAVSVSSYLVSSLLSDLNEIYDDF
jgi:hypothetical protein